MKVKSMVAAVAIALTAFSSYANDTQDLLTITGSASFSSRLNDVTGSFTDIFNFNLVQPSLVSSSITNTSFIFTSSTSGLIGSFAAWLDSTPLSLSLVTTPIGGGTSFEFQLLSGGTSMAYGSHTLTVSGVRDSSGGSYGGSIYTAPVPEPETVAMLLAGLGLVGTIARRRKMSAAANA